MCQGSAFCPLPRVGSGFQTPGEWMAEIPEPCRPRGSEGCLEEQRSKELQHMNVHWAPTGEAMRACQAVLIKQADFHPDTLVRSKRLACSSCQLSEGICIRRMLKVSIFIACAYILHAFVLACQYASQRSHLRSNQTLSTQENFITALLCLLMHFPLHVYPSCLSCSNLNKTAQHVQRTSAPF